MIKSRSPIPFSNPIIPSNFLCLCSAILLQQCKCRIDSLDAPIKRTAIELLNRRIESDEVFRQFVRLCDAVAGESGV